MTPRSTDHTEWVRCLLNEHERALVRYAMKHTGDLEHARDVVQDTFLKLIRADRTAVEGHAAEWLFTVCRNRCLDVLRKERRMKTMSEVPEQSVATSADAPADCAVTERHDDVLHGFGALPDRQQEVIRLKFQNGLSYREISRVTELSVSNVGFLIHTGLKTLREKLAVQTRREMNPNAGIAR